MKRTGFVLTILTLCSHTAGFGREDTRVNTNELENQLDSLLQPLVEDGLISGAILIAVNDSVLCDQAYGMADIEAGIPNTANTKFQIASITKMFTSVSILQLFERDQLDLQDKLSKYLPDIPNANNITIYNLLTHTSGIPSYNNLEERNTNFDGIIQNIKELPSRFGPGEDEEYSNSNMVLLTYVLEVITRMPYDEYLEKNIFVPCGMSHSGLLPLDSWRIIDSLANGYTFAQNGRVQEAVRIRHAGKGDGGLYSTVGDLFKFSKSICDGTLVSLETRDLMFKPEIERSGRVFGVGCVVEDYDDWHSISHDGGAVGVRTRLVMFTKPEVKVTVIILFNTDFMLANLVNKQIEDIALNKPWVPLFRADQALIDSFRKFTGMYEIDADTVTIGIENGRVFFQQHNQETYDACVYSNNSIYIRKTNSRYHFSMDEESHKVTLVGFIGTPVSAFMVNGSRIDEH